MERTYFLLIISEDSAEVRSITPIGIGPLTALLAFRLRPPPEKAKTTSAAAVPPPESLPCLILAGSSDGRVSALLATKGGRDITDVGLIWHDPDRLSVSRIRLVQISAAAAGSAPPAKSRSGAGLSCRFLLAKGNFLVMVSARLVAAGAGGQWRVAEATTQSSLNAGSGAVVGAEIGEEREDLLVATQKGPLLRLYKNTFFKFLVPVRYL
jgi:hypothetical protein